MEKGYVYVNAIQNSEIVHIYALKSFIEVVYLEEGKNKSVTIQCLQETHNGQHRNAFTFDTIPLPPAKIDHPLNGEISKILSLAHYRSTDGLNEELQWVSEQDTYLFYGEKTEENILSVKNKKNKHPSFLKLDHSKLVSPKELFSVSFFKENLAFALKAHGAQKTPHGLPYSMHLVRVAMEVINALSQEPLSYDEANVAIACALLHDVHEDTTVRISRHTCLGGNAEVIAKGVEALTKNTMLPTKAAQMKESLQKLSKRQNCVGMVKLADRITNLDTPPTHWDDAKKHYYLEESKLILEALGYTHAYLAQKLRDKIGHYQLYLNV